MNENGALSRLCTGIAPAPPNSGSAANPVAADGDQQTRDDADAGPRCWAAEKHQAEKGILVGGSVHRNKPNTERRGHAAGRKPNPGTEKRPGQYRAELAHAAILAGGVG